MRVQFCDAMVARCRDSGTIFMTGDLGFMALEPLQSAMGDRFINAGVAEQNMVSVAAGLAKSGLEVWVYTIAPFCYARPFEQVRNDVSFHNLPVRLVGNGGGYGYGVMGPTHHAIEDYGVLLSLSNMSVFVPVFDEDLAAIVGRVGETTGPAYLRLGRGEKPRDFPAPAYSPWRQLTQGDGALVIAVGPLAGAYIQAAADLPLEQRPNLWALSELPLERAPMPAELRSQLRDAPLVCVAEEHVRRGSFGAELALFMAEQGIPVRKFVHLCARAHHYDRYGSQPYLRRLSGLDPASMLSAISMTQTRPA